MVARDDGRAGELDVRILGPIEVWKGQERVAIAGGRQRLLLAALALRPGYTVPMSDLIEAVWGDDPPETAWRQVQNGVSMLRQPLGATWLRSEPEGYRLRVAADQVDLGRFRSGMAEGRRLASDGRARLAADAMREALALWRGPAFAGVAGGLVHRAAQLDEERLAAQEGCLEQELAAGGGEGLQAELAALLAQHPLRERLAAALMLALYRSGRQAEALEVFRRVSRALADQLGVDPGPDLLQRYKQILNADPALSVPPNDFWEPTPAPAVRPAQLPAAPPVFAGREGEMRMLDQWLSNHDIRPAGPVLISGPAGVGKTALALHWGHRVADRFLDGQLYLNLRGFHPGGASLDPAEAIRDLLDALQVDPRRIPVGLDAQAALYRSLLPGRRILIVLDNARDSDQLRDLLPGAPGVMVVVTSRNLLTGLVTTHGAQPLGLDLLTTPEATDLLARRLGPRVDADRGAVAEMIRSCTRLPLALAVMAARAGTRPHLPLAAIAAELRQGGAQLDALATGDPSTDVRSVFSWSYLRLSQPAGRLFRLLGRHLGPDISAAAAASLAALPVHRLRPLLAELVETNMIVEHVPGRYSMHDLLSAYAAELTGEGGGLAGGGLAGGELAGGEVAGGEARQGLHRLLDHYLRTAYAAAMLVDPYREPIPLPSSPGGTTPEPIATAEQALAWFTAEHRVLLAAAAQPDLPAYQWRLAWCVVNVMDRRGYWHEQAGCHKAALAAATREADLIGQAHCHRGLARAYVQLNRRAEARSHFDQAIACCRAAGDDLLRAFVLRNVAELMEHERCYDSAMAFAEQALELFRVAGHRAGLSNTLHQLGWYRALLGDHERALVDLGRALALLKEADHRYGQASTLDSLGYTHHHLGNHRLAIGYLGRAVGLFEAEGDRYYEAVALDHLGDAHRSADEQAEAKDAWHRALAILEDLAHPEANRVRAKL